MLTLYYGSDAWRLRHAAGLFADSWRTSYGSAPLIVQGDIASSVDELERLLKYPSLFQKQSAAVVHCPLEETGIEDLLENRPENTDILLVARTAQKQTAQQKKALSGYVALTDTVETFEPLMGMALADWVRQFATERDRTIESAAVAELTDRAGNESWNLANELEKLCAFSPQTITADAVRRLVPSGQREDQWELSNAIAAHDKRAGVVALFRQVRRGVPEPLLLGTIASAVRTLLMVRDLADRGRSASAIAEATRLHPYVVSKTMRGAAQYRPDQLMAAHRTLAELDRHAKDGRADSIDGLFATLLAL